MNGTEAEIGQWYASADKGEVFQVVGRDEESRTIEIQSVDGDLDEIDGDTWATLPLERIEPPEDERDPWDEGLPAAPFSADVPEAVERLGP